MGDEGRGGEGNAPRELFDPGVPFLLPPLTLTTRVWWLSHEWLAAQHVSY